MWDPRSTTTVLDKLANLILVSGSIIEYKGTSDVILDVIILL